MFRTIVLLTPIYITFFWSIALTANKKKDNIPQLLLSKFMLLPAICFITLYFHLEHYSPAYPIFDCALQFAISLLFPVYYIYFRLLTVEAKFLFKVHSRYLALPVLIPSIYCVGVLLTSWDDYNAWLSNGNAFSDSSYIQFLSVMRVIIQIHFLIQLGFTMIGNQILIHKYGVKAEQFYSDMEEENYNNAKIMNYCIVLTGAVLLIIFSVDRQFTLPKDTFLYTFFSISSIMLYLIGYLGIKQKPVNPTFDLSNNDDVLNQLEIIPPDSRKKILNKMLVLFEEEKIYLNSQLNIMDIVQAVGTNRTYISSIINQLYNQNFCSFVNNYRIIELEKILLENSDYTNEVLADSCGFGSLNSLKRAIYGKTGLTLPEWKKKVLTASNSDI